MICPLNRSVLVIASCVYIVSHMIRCLDSSIRGGGHVTTNSHRHCIFIYFFNKPHVTYYIIFIIKKKIWKSLRVVRSSAFHSVSVYRSTIILLLSCGYLFIYFVLFIPLRVVVHRKNCRPKTCPLAARKTKTRRRRMTTRTMTLLRWVGCKTRICSKVSRNFLSVYTAKYYKWYEQYCTKTVDMEKDKKKKKSRILITCVRATDVSSEKFGRIIHRVI